MVVKYIFKNNWKIETRDQWPCFAISEPDTPETPALVGEAARIECPLKISASILTSFKICFSQLETVKEETALWGFTKLTIICGSFTPHEFFLSNFLGCHKHINFSLLKKKINLEVWVCAYAKFLTVYLVEICNLFLISQGNWCSNFWIQKPLVLRLVLILKQALNSKPCEKDTSVQVVTLDTPKQFLHPK